MLLVFFMPMIFRFGTFGHLWGGGGGGGGDCPPVPPLLKISLSVKLLVLLAGQLYEVDVHEHTCGMLRNKIEFSIHAGTKRKSD